MQVDLTRSAMLRWNLSSAEEAAARDLLGMYQRDLGLPAQLVTELSRPAVRAEYWAEMQGIASRAEVPFEEVVCGNLYYDALKVVLVGCTAFAVDTSTGPFHARNLGGARTILFGDTPCKPGSSARGRVNLPRLAGRVL